MTDQTTETLQRTMKAIVDSAPQAPDMPVRQVTRHRSPVLVLSAAFGAVLLLGAVTLVVRGIGSERGELAGPSMANTATTGPIGDGSTATDASGLEPNTDSTLLIVPDPDQVARLMEDFSPMIGTVHPLGWRLDLQAEQANCLLPGADVLVQEMLGSRPASDFPLGERLTAPHLAAACTDNDYARENGYTVAGATVCVSETGRHSAPAVVIDGTDCATAGDDLRPITEDDLAELNHMRAVEVALLAVLSESGCPTFSEAQDWVNEQVADLDLDMTVVGSGNEGTDVCYRGGVLWETDQVFITGIG